MTALSNKKGQTFIEFILLLLVMISMSLGLISGFNRALGERWVAMVKVISNPTVTEIELR
jgi:hypothetical protein